MILLLPNPQKGDLAFDNTFNCLRVYNGVRWVCSHQNPNDETPNLLLINSTINGAGGGTRVFVDSNKNVYMLGLFSGSCTIGNTTLISNGGNDVYLMKINSSGDFLWAKSFGSSGNDNAEGVTADNYEIFI